MVLFGGGGMRGFIRGCAWFYLGDVHGFIWGGMRGFIWAVCVVLFGGHAWFFQGGMHGFSRGGMHSFVSFFGYNEIRSMSGQYASYWNAFLLLELYLSSCGNIVETKSCSLHKRIFHVDLQMY